MNICYNSYIPVKIDYTDLFDIMAFFSGDLEGKNGHEEMAQKIAAQGKEYTEKHWRYADMEACQSKARSKAVMLDTDKDLHHFRLLPVGT